MMFHNVWLYYPVDGVALLNSRRNIASVFAPMNVECIDFCFIILFVWLPLYSFSSLAPFSDNQILPGTVIGLKNNLPNFASAYETQSSVASIDGIFCSIY